MAGLARVEALSDVGHAGGDLVDHLRRQLLRVMGGSVCGHGRRQSLSTCYAVAVPVCLINVGWYPCYEHSGFVESLDLSIRTKLHNYAVFQP